MAQKPAVFTQSAGRLRDLKHQHHLVSLQHKSLKKADAGEPEHNVLCRTCEVGVCMGLSMRQRWTASLKHYKDFRGICQYTANFWPSIALVTLVKNPFQCMNPVSC